MAIATGLGLGYLPKAPGTWGTLLAFPLHFALVNLSPAGYLAGLGILLVIAVAAAGAAEKILDFRDPGVVVIDEVIGMLIALIAAPNHVLYLAAAFLLFRFFDILKPFPIRLVDQRLHGGIGIVADDLLAGIFTLLIMQGVYYFVG
jgi:phosphatidylglycerophosphatase A